jgi:tetratricopeptide (TPR) repeat protein
MAKFALALAVSVFGFGVALARGLDDAGAAMIAAQHGDYEQAIRLLTSALTAGDLSPQNTMLAYHNRGNAYQDKGDYVHAIADYDAAIKIRPGYANAWYARGRAQFAQGLFPAAATDFVKSASLDPKDAYAMIWLHLARRRTAANDGGELARNAMKIDLARWPGAVINLYLGTSTPRRRARPRPKATRNRCARRRSISANTNCCGRTRPRQGRCSRKRRRFARRPPTKSTAPPWS